ncbi:unnamed protein product, partial [Allacma fusca]
IILFVYINKYLGT